MHQPDIYYINLASRPDRRLFMETQFANLGLNAIRVDAVSRDELSPEQLARFCNPRRRWSMTASRYACNLSHLRAWQALVASEAPRAVFFEDDALLSPLLLEFLDALSTTKTWPPLIRLELNGRGYYRSAEAATSNVQLRKRTSPDVGAAGYVLSADAARWLLADPELHRRLVDSVLFAPFSRIGRRLSAMSTSPALCVQLGMRDATTGASSLSQTGEDVVHKAQRKRRPFVKFSRHLEVWLTQDIPEGLCEWAARRRSVFHEIDTTGLAPRAGRSS